MSDGHRHLASAQKGADRRKGCPRGRDQNEWKTHQLQTIPDELAEEVCAAIEAATAALPRLFARFQRERGPEVGAPLNASLELESEAAAHAAGEAASARARLEPRPSTSFAASTGLIP